MRLIDADARIAEIKKAYCTGCENYGGIRCRSCWVDDAIGLFEDAPTVDAMEVVHGRWEESIDCGTQMHRCSVCGARVVKGLYEYENPNLYCYHCGAKMDGGNDNGCQE